ncbi:hypothetical protein [Paraburkholderia caledonica]|uniref:MacB-like periplasmic core domain-containing protein n=1 Tax=Paraburkholderia caledonica TaxID=134536 RepID=A0AB73ILF6_9BURK|nr:hypothetical protein [Paraburkholderia caledonica]
MRGKLLQGLASVAGVGLTGVVSFFIGVQTNLVTADADHATRHIDYVVNREGLWNSTAPVDDVTGAVHDREGRVVDAISRQSVDLFNFNRRDAPEFDLQIDATSSDGGLPRLLGKPSVTVNGSDDYPAEEKVKLITKGSTLSIIVHFPSLSQTRDLSPARKVALYFSGRQSPVLSVSVRGSGIKEGKNAYVAYGEWTQRNLPFYVRHWLPLQLVLAILLMVVVSAGIVVSNRSRQRRFYAVTPSVIEGRLDALYPGGAEGKHSSAARDVALSVWSKIHSMHNPIDRFLSEKPAPEKFVSNRAVP